MPDDEFSPVYVDGRPFNQLARDQERAAGSPETFPDFAIPFNPLVAMRKPSGLEDIPAISAWFPDVCQDAEHQPPSMIHVPEGKRYRHNCPKCGTTQYIYPNGYRL